MFHVSVKFSNLARDREGSQERFLREGEKEVLRQRRMMTVSGIVISISKK
jgi:hypothetical protein